MLFYYVAQFIPDENDSYEVHFPDLEGCMTYGQTKDEALANAKEALELYLEPDLPYKSIEDFPTPTPIENIKNPNDGFLSYIAAEIDLFNYSKSVKKTLSIPAWLNEKALEKNINFSQTLQEALIKKLELY